MQCATLHPFGILTLRQGPLRRARGHQSSVRASGDKQYEAHPFRGLELSSNSSKPRLAKPSSSRAYALQAFTFFTPEGLVRLQGPAQAPAKGVGEVLKLHAPLPTWQEQGLCMGSTFWVAATNGVDPARRIKIAGFCRSKDMLAEVVEHSVKQRGGEVMQCESSVNSNLHENLKMIVALPLLWGIPPEHEALSAAIAMGGGIVEKVYWQWFLY